MACNKGRISAAKPTLPGAAAPGVPCSLERPVRGAEHGLHASRVVLEDKVRKRKVVDLGPIMLDAERCVLCSRCLRFEREVTGTNRASFHMHGDATTYPVGAIIVRERNASGCSTAAMALLKRPLPLASRIL